MKNPKWLLCEDDWYDISWASDFFPEVGVFSKDFCYWDLFYSRFEDELTLNCPKCGHQKSNYELKKRGRFKCKKCLIKFSLTTGTFIENTKIEYYYWYRLAWLLANLKVPINSSWLSRDLELTQKTTYYMLTTIKEALGLKGNGINYKMPKDTNEHGILFALLALKPPEPPEPLFKPPEPPVNIEVETLNAKPVRKTCIRCKDEKAIMFFEDDSDKCKECCGIYKKERLKKWEMA